MKVFKYYDHTTKGQLIQAVYDGNKEKLKNVDSAIPQDFVNETQYNPFWFVMDYNRNTIFGEIRHLRDIAEENNIELIKVNL